MNHEGLIKTVRGLLGVALVLPLGAWTASLEITNVIRVGGALQLGWNAPGPDTAYTLQSRDALGDGLWIAVRGELPAPLGATEWIDPRPLDAGARFYRVLAVPATRRGEVLSGVVWTELSQALLGFLLSSQGIPVTPQYGVRVYKLTYETIDPLGARTQASGVLAVPVGVNTALPVLSYQHGTLTSRDEAPTADLYGETMLGVVMASTGYAAVIPDLLGLGASPGLHPYHHAGSEATAAVDMLRAARTFASTNGVTLGGKLFLCGYSQGGHATMALHRELEDYHSAEFTVTASAPMAGAYDLSGVTAADFLSDRVMPNPYYFPYLLAAYQEVYHLAASLGDLLVAPYSTNLPPMFNGQFTGEQINDRMPQRPMEILKPEIAAAFREDPRHPLRLALEDNDVHRWTPLAPMRLYHCSGDQDVTPANSVAARDSFVSRGATNVVLVDPSPQTNHVGCATPSLLAAKAWFDSLR